MLCCIFSLYVHDNNYLFDLNESRISILIKIICESRNNFKFNLALFLSDGISNRHLLLTSFCSIRLRKTVNLHINRMYDEYFIKNATIQRRIRYI